MKNTALYKIKEYLPATVKFALDKIPEDVLCRISEIRLRSGNVATVTVSGKNLYLTDTGCSKNPVRCVKVTGEEIDNFIYKLCGGSVYSYENTVKNGYITRFGIRTGICGVATVNGNEICGFSKITGVNIRIPNHVPGCCENLIKHIRANGFPELGGILVVSPPGVGKTTVLRELAIRLSAGITEGDSGETRAYRVSVVDERNEIYIPELFSGCMVDAICGAPKKSGLECASRVMSPEIIICDEIGSESDARAINDAHIGGVVFIASMHGNSVKSVMSKPAVSKLCNDGVFSYIYLLSINDGTVRGTLHSIKECGEN